MGTVKIRFEVEYDIEVAEDYEGGVNLGMRGDFIQEDVEDKLNELLRGYIDWDDADHDVRIMKVDGWTVEELGF